MINVVALVLAVSPLNTPNDLSLVEQMSLVKYYNVVEFNTNGLSQYGYDQCRHAVNILLNQNKNTWTVTGHFHNDIQDTPIVYAKTNDESIIITCEGNK